MKNNEIAKTEYHEKIATNLTESNYGASRSGILKIINKLSSDELASLMYNCYRTAEKCGKDNFWTDE